ncbi:9530_t:CDS:2, partial [Gigaspora rosea]
MTEENKEIEEKSDNDYDRRPGVRFFADAYDIFAINLVLKVATPIGTFIGQFSFGILADLLGRKRMYGIELMIILVSTLAICLVANSFVYDPNSKTFVSNASIISAQGLMLFWRILLDIGIGGDYPLSEIIASEFTATKHRGAMIAAVFAMQGFGILTATITSTIVVVAFHSSISTTN